MTRFIRQKMAMVFMVLLAACSGGSDKPAGDATRHIVLGFSQIGAESEWRTANTRSIQEAAPEAGITLRFSDAQQKQENQIKALRSFIAQKVDVIAFSPVVETGWETVLREAKDAKIPVILTDRAVEVSDDTLYLSLIGSDFVKEGRKAGRWLTEYYTTGAGQHQKMSQDNVSYLLNKHATTARPGCPELPEHVHAHQLRHARAMQMLRAGVPLPRIKEFLGHADITTTSIYATADNQMVRDAVQRAASSTPEPVPIWKGDDEMILQLAALT